MLATYVEDKKTPATFDAARSAMSMALASVIGATPSTEVLALALAKTVLECGRQGELLWTSAHCHNLGNIKAGPQYQGSFTAFTCNEVLGGKVVWFSPHGRLSGKNGVVVAEPYETPPGHPQCRFRAYQDHFDGALEYVEFVASGRYKDAWAELLEGDAAGYVAALHRKGYFTADPDVYAKGVVSLHREFIAKLSARPAPDMWIPSVEVIDARVKKQEWNQREIQAIATEVVASSLADNLLDLRRDAHRQMAISETDDPDGELLDPRDEDTVVDGKPNS
jgi:hypothetical protein